MKVRTVFCTKNGKGCTLGRLLKTNFRVLVSRETNEHYLRCSQFVCDCTENFVGKVYKIEILELPGGNYDKVKTKKNAPLFNGWRREVYPIE